MTPITLTGPFVMQHPGNPANWILLADFKGIPKGFVYDFASIPRLFWNIISPTELGDEGPLEHDFDYRSKRVARKTADEKFLANMEKEGIAWWKRKLAYSVVRAAGWASYGKCPVVIEELVAA
jgi:hypothetical protein